VTRLHENCTRLHGATRNNALPPGTVLREGDRLRFVLHCLPDGRFRAASATVIKAV
jgi:hypothetical protein